MWSMQSGYREEFSCEELAEFRDASLPEYELGSRGIQSSLRNWQLWVQLWSVNQRATEAEESPLLRFVARTRLVKTLQRNSHCGERLPSKD
jgi:hypothetical protein